MKATRTTKSQELMADLEAASDVVEGTAANDAQRAPETPAATETSAQPHQPAGAASVPATVPAQQLTAKPFFNEPVVPDGYVRRRGVKDPGIALNVRVPTNLFDRLGRVSNRTGITQKDIVARALEKELDVIERVVSEQGS